MILKERFWSKVDKTPGQGPNGDCWQWLGKVNPVNGYGYITEGRRVLGTHVVSYRLAFGTPPPETPWVLHRCDNPPCVRPEHLFAGTPQDNVADRHRKGRDARGERSGAHTHPERRPRGATHWTRTRPDLVEAMRGERNHRARISDAEMKMIVQRVQAGPRGTRTMVAREYGISPCSISAWIHGRNRRRLIFLILVIALTLVGVSWRIQADVDQRSRSPGPVGHARASPHIRGSRGRRLQGLCLRREDAPHLPQARLNHGRTVDR